MQNFKRVIAGCLLLILTSKSFSQIILSTPNVESKLYVGNGRNQPLIVGLGGSEGGNAWASEHWKETRERFLEKGYAFLAVAYFKAKGTPDTLQKIAVDDVHYAIEMAKKHKKINKKKIAVIGGSRGADLALLLGAHYKDIKCVVGMAPSHVAFPGHTNHFTTSAWAYQNKELPFVPVNEASVPFLMKRDLRGAFEAMLEDAAAEEKALIKVEKINGPVLLLSGTEDEICPSTPMAEKIIARLAAHKFKHRHEHIAVRGGHSAPLRHFDSVFTFLEANFAQK